MDYKLNSKDVDIMQLNGVEFWRRSNAIIYAEYTTTTDSTLTTTKFKTATEMVAWCSSNTTIKTIKCVNLNNEEEFSCYQMFRGCSNLESVDLSEFDTTYCTSMNSMFHQCGVLKSLDLSSFNTSKVTDMYNMFNSCYLLTTIDVSNFDTSNVISMFGMFSSCRALINLDLSSFNTSKVTDMYQMFSYCYVLTHITVSNGFNTSQVTSYAYIFTSSTALESLHYNVTSLPTINTSIFSTLTSTCPIHLPQNLIKTALLDTSWREIGTRISSYGRAREYYQNGQVSTTFDLSSLAVGNYNVCLINMNTGYNNTAGTGTIRTVQTYGSGATMYAFSTPVATTNILIPYANTTASPPITCKLARCGDNYNFESSVFATDMADTTWDRTIASGTATSMTIPSGAIIAVTPIGGTV